MRLGCVGCLLLIIVILVIVISAAAVIFLSVNIFGTPDGPPGSHSKGDGYAAQQKLYELLLRQSGQSTRRDPIVLTEREANAFLTRHLEEAAGVPLSPLSVRFFKGEASLQGQTPFKKLLQGPPFAQLLPYIPDKRLDQPVWVTVRGRISVKPGPGGRTRYGEVTLTDFTLGKQPLSASLLYVMLGPSGAGLLRWQVPTVVEGMEVDDGRLIIRTR